MIAAIASDIKCEVNTMRGGAGGGEHIDSTLIRIAFMWSRSGFVLYVRDAIDRSFFMHSQEQPSGKPGKQLYTRTRDGACGSLGRTTATRAG